PKEMLKERNTLEVAVSNLMTNRIIDLDRRGVNWKKFYNTNMPARRRENAGPDGLFTAARWTPRESGLIGPVALVPDERFSPGAVGLQPWLLSPRRIAAPEFSRGFQPTVSVIFNPRRVSDD